MKGRSPRRQQGAVTLLGAVFLITAVTVLLTAAQRMAGSSVVDSALHRDGVQALFLAESGLERAAWRLDGGAACTGLPGESDDLGAGVFTIVSAIPVGAECRVRVLGRVTSPGAAVAVSRNIEGDFTTASSAGGWAIGKPDGDGLMINYDGNNWTRAGSGTGLPDKDLFGVSCVTADDCWAVGEDHDGEMILHWDGANWTRAGPYAGIPDAKLFSVHCVDSRDCWAVGEDKDGELTIHWDGASWSRIGPYPGIPNAKLYSVHCVAIDDCWAVGEDKDGELISLWVGFSWSRSGPYPSVANEDLVSVHCAASDDCWAVGEKDGYENINRWDGSTWTRIGNVPSIPSEDLYGVHMVSATEGYVVGKDGTMAVWDGTAWTGHPPITDKDLLAVAGYDAIGGIVELVRWREVIQ